MLDFGVEKLFRDAAIFLHMDATVDISQIQDRQVDVPADRRQVCGAGVSRSPDWRSRNAGSDSAGPAFVAQRANVLPRCVRRKPTSTIASPISCTDARRLAEQHEADQQREAGHQRGEHRRPRRAEQHHRAGEQIDRARPRQHALQQDLQQRFPTGRTTMMRRSRTAPSGSGNPASDTTLTIAVARIGGMRHSRSSIGESWRSTARRRRKRDRREGRARPMVASASMPMTQTPPTMTQRADEARGRQAIPCSDQAGKEQAEQRRARRLDDAAMAERHQQKPGIADDGERRPAEQRQQRFRAASRCRRDRADCAASAAAARAPPRRSGARRDRPAKSDRDAMAGGDETERPEQRRAGAAAMPIAIRADHAVSQPAASRRFLARYHRFCIRRRDRIGYPVNYRGELPSRNARSILRSN